VLFVITVLTVRNNRIKKCGVKDMQLFIPKYMQNIMVVIWERRKKIVSVSIVIWNPLNHAKFL